MKKNDEIRKIGKDEMNLVEFPITMLSKRNSSEKNVLEFTDTITMGDGTDVTREWTVSGSEKYGLPLAIDNDVLLALLVLGKENNFSSPVIYFSRYRLLKIMGLETDAGSNYKRLEETFDRLTGVRIKSKNSFWDNERKAYVSVNVGIFDEYRIYEGKVKKGAYMQDSLPLSYVRLNNTLYQSIKAGYIKSLEVDIYFILKSSIAKRLYRYLDKKRYDGKKKFEMNLFTLAYAHIGFDNETYRFASKIKEKLAPAHNELINAGFLKSVEYQLTADGSSEKVVYTFGRKPALNSEIPAPSENMNEKALIVDPLLNSMLETGVTRKVAEQILREHNREAVQSQLEALPYRKAGDPAAVLVASIQDDWNYPASYKASRRKTKSASQKEKDREAKAAEEREKEERRERIENYLSALPEPEKTSLLKEARELARREGGAMFKNREIPECIVKAYQHVLVEKSLESPRQTCGV
jgi:hypothetical protein